MFFFLYVFSLSWLHRWICLILRGIKRIRSLSCWIAGGWKLIRYLIRIICLITSLMMFIAIIRGMHAWVMVADRWRMMIKWRWLWNICPWWYLRRIWSERKKILFFLFLRLIWFFLALILFNYFLIRLLTFSLAIHLATWRINFLFIPKFEHILDSLNLLRNMILIIAFLGNNLLNFSIEICDSIINFCDFFLNLLEKYKFLYFSNFTNLKNLCNSFFTLLDFKNLFLH